MTADREIGLIEKLDKVLLEVLKRKRSDYATEDVLSNFKRLAQVARAFNLDVQTPLGYSLFMVLMKIDRINNLVKSEKTPTNESIDDSFGDGINYLKLAYCIWQEEAEERLKENLPF